jgi:hypothetical protein
VRRGLAALLIVAGGMALGTHARAAFAPATDLDAFMQEVLARRDDNWKKLQQYILDEREQIELRGPARIRLWGERRDYTWYVRDGFFVRSPVSFNGVAISEADRRKYEADYLRRVQAREQPADESGFSTAPPAVDEPPADIAGLIRQSRQPRFISSAYFMRFKFDAGTYALVAREQLEGREVLRIEYYPTNLFRPDEKTRGDENGNANAVLRRLLNKVDRGWLRAHVRRAAGASSPPWATQSRVLSADVGRHQARGD